LVLTYGKCPSKACFNWIIFGFSFNQDALSFFENSDWQQKIFFALWWVIHKLYVNVLTFKYSKANKAYYVATFA